MIGVEVSAIAKIQWNTHLSPKSRVMDRMPKVTMDEPLTPQRPEQSCLFFRSMAEGGTTVTSAPVFNEESAGQSLHWLKIAGDLLVGQDLVTASNWPEHFPTSDKEVDISWRHLQMFNGTSKIIQL